MQNQTAPASDAAPNAAPDALSDAAHFREVLRELVDMASDIARHFHHEITAGYAEAPEKAAAFDRVARTLRRTILLATRLDAPPKPARTPTPHDPAQHRRIARTHLIRKVEDGIAKHAEPNEAETLRAEFRERLDSPDLEDDLYTRPIQTIIDDILQDLGVHDFSKYGFWKRRTQADIQAIEALASEPPAIPPEIRTIDPAALPNPYPKTRQRCEGEAKAIAEVLRYDHTNRR